MEKDIVKDLERENSSLRKEILELKIERENNRTLEEQLKHAQKMEAVANIAGGIAHDFNNILQSIMGHTQIALIQPELDEGIKKTLFQIEKIIKKGSSLTGQLLTFGRKGNTKKKPLDLNKKIREIKNLLGRTIPKMIDVDLFLSDDLGMINADEGQIDQVLMNLSLNAKDAMPEGGELIFRTKNVNLSEDGVLAYLNAKPGEHVLLSVSDNGCGMAQDVLNHIFEPFFTTKEGSKGTGLGLSMVYAIVKSHDGFVYCSSKEGEGSTFKLYFPLLRENGIRLDLDGEKGKRCLSGGSETIMMVDDEADILKVWKKILEDYGYRVLTALSGEEAIDKFTRNNVEVTVLDIGMPGMGGMRCLKELISYKKDTKVIISSGYRIGGNEKTGLMDDVNAFLLKPYTVEDFLSTIRGVLETEAYFEVSANW